MNSLDEQVNAVISMIHAAGGRAGIEPDAPDYVKQAFLDMILGCRECRATIRGRHDGTAN